MQLAAVLASLVGRWIGMPTARLRLLVACGAAGGIASAYNAPIGGALFVAEIILGTLAMESFGPLVFSSVIATLTVRQFLGTDPMYEISMPLVKLSSNWEILPHLLLGLVAGLAAPWFLRGLRASERLFAATKLPPLRPARARRGRSSARWRSFTPQVCGNGYSVVNVLLHAHWVWQTVLAVLDFQARGHRRDVRQRRGRRGVHAHALRRGQHWLSVRPRGARALAGHARRWSACSSWSAWARCSPPRRTRPSWRSS